MSGKIPQSNHIIHRVRPITKPTYDKNEEYRLAEYHFDVTDYWQGYIRFAKVDNKKN